MSPFQVGLREYYTKFMQMYTGIGRNKVSDFDGLGKDTVLAFGRDDYEIQTPIFGIYVKQQSYYDQLNTKRGEYLTSNLYLKFTQLPSSSSPQPSAL